MELPLLIHNWRETARESFAFNTEISTSDSGVEQRWANAIYPRRSLSMVSLHQRDDWQRILLNEVGLFGQVVTIPDPVNIAACIIQNANAGSSTIIISKPVPPGRYAVIGGSRSIIIEITSMSGAGAFSNAYSDAYDVATSTGAQEATLTSPFGIDIPAGSSLHFLLDGYLGDTQRISSPLSTLFQPAIEFLQQPETSTLLPCDLTTYSDGRYILHHLPDWSSPIRSQVNTPYDSVDYGGVIRNTRKFTYPYFQYDLDYLEGSIDTINTLKGLFTQMKGQRGSFWCPSFTCDLVPLTGMTTDSNTMVVEDSPLLNSTIQPEYGVTIFLNDGRWLFRKVTSVSEGGVGEGSFSNAYDQSYDALTTQSTAKTITFDANSSFNFTKNDILMMSITRISRFASDSLSIQWYSTYAAKMRMNIRTCRN